MTYCCCILQLASTSARVDASGTNLKSAAKCPEKTINKTTKDSDFSEIRNNKYLCVLLLIFCCFSYYSANVCICSESSTP